jgi:hypothetical protein
MFTIPVEDAMYGYSQFLLNIYFFKLLQQRKSMVAYSKAINKAEL